MQAGMNHKGREMPRVYKRLGIYEPIFVPKETNAAAESLSEFDYDDANGIES